MVFSVYGVYAHYSKDHVPKSNGKEKAAKWTNMTAKQSLQHSPDLDPTAPITSNIPPREASRVGEMRGICPKNAPRSPRIGTNMHQI